jgi:hypothetical protein
MAEIKGVDAVAAAVGRWQPSDLAYIESVQFTAQDGDHLAEVFITGLLQRRDSALREWPSEGATTYRITIRFLGVRQLRLKEFGGPPTQIMGFDIIDESGRGLECVQFTIEDYEHDRIGFTCTAIEVVSVVQVDGPRT